MNRPYSIHDYSGTTETGRRYLAEWIDYHSKSAQHEFDNAGSHSDSCFYFDYYRERAASEYYAALVFRLALLHKTTPIRAMRMLRHEVMPS